MPIAAAIGAVGAIGSAGIGAYASGQASDKAIAAQQAMFGVAQQAQQPFITAGQSAAGTLNKLLTPGPDQTATLNQLPGYQFAQNWGQKAVQNIGSTQGFGGNTLTAGANFATGLAQQQFGSLAGLLQNLANTGEAGAGSLSGAAVTTGQGVGNSAAAGTLGTANALSGGLTGSANSVTNALLLNKLFGGGAGIGNSVNSAGSGIYSASGFGG